MSPLSPSPTPAAPASLSLAEPASRLHVRISLALLLIFIALCAALDLAARSDRVANFLDDRALAEHQAKNRPFLRTHNYGDWFENLMLGQLSKADYSHGGIYFFGSSNLVFCADFAPPSTNLSPGELKLIHNYGLSNGNPTEIRQFIQYFVGHEGLLKAGGEKTRIVLCLSQDDLLEDSEQGSGAGGFFPAYLNGSGFFHYDINTGITPLPMRAAEKNFKLRRTRIRSFVNRLQRAIERVPTPHPDIDAMRREAKRVGAKDWPVPPNPPLGQMRELETLLDYLKSKGVDAVVLLMPTGSWYDGVPFHEGFVTQVPKMCAAKNVPLVDCGHLLRDDQYMDFHHATFEGAARFRKVLVDLAREHLARI